MKKMIICAVAAIVFGGCGIYNKYSRPESIDTTAEGIFRGEAAERADSALNFGATEWREVFTDECLQRLIDSAMVRNTDLRVARLRIDEAEASLKAARLAYVPSFAFAPNGAVSSFDNSKAAWTYSVPVTASWQVDLFARLTNAKRRAKAAVEGSRAYCQAVRSRVIAGVANAYYTLLMLDAQLAVTEQTAESWRESVETMRLMKDAGMATDAAVRQYEANHYALQSSVLQLRDQIFTAENSLCALLGDTPHSIERGSLDSQHMPDDLRTGIPVRLLSARPDVEYAEKTLVQAFYATNEARAALYPSISLSGSAGWTNSAGVAIVNPGKLLLSAAASLLQPIFQNGALRARLKIAKAQQEEAELQFRQTVLNAGNEVNNAMAECQTARANRTICEQKVDALASAAESTELLMKHGSTTYLEVLVARQALLGARMDLITNSFNELQSAVNLYQALGGGRE